MTDTNITLAIDVIAGKLGVAAESILPHYVQWYTASAITWIVFGAIGLLFTFRWNMDKIDYDEWGFPPSVLKWVLVLIFSIVIAFNVADLVGTEGIATHRLINDIRG